MLLLAIVLMAACSVLEGTEGGGTDPGTDPVIPTDPVADGGVLILCEGNYNAGNSTLSYYSPTEKKVENDIFRRVNGIPMGDTGQSICIFDGKVFIAVENSGVIWALDENTFQLQGRLTASAANHIINPRYVHRVYKDKAYVTDLYSPYINIFNPQTMEYKGSISVEGISMNGYSSTEEMVQYDKYVFVNCWSYSNKILVIDSDKDQLINTIELGSWQPKSMVVDNAGKLWVITDGGYEMVGEGFGDNIPHLYRIDAVSQRIELDLSLNTDEANVQLAYNSTEDILYILDNDVYRMKITDEVFPTEPFIMAPVSNGKRNFLYGIGVNPVNGEVYVADAIDYSQSGVVYRYGADGVLLDKFRVGVTPNHFAFCKKSTADIDDATEEEPETDPALVTTVFEFMPAPGHQVNGYTIVGDFIWAGATMQEACERALKHFRKKYMISLGAQGGYVIAGFDHNVMNSQGGYDLVIKGNPFDYQSEPGIIWVMKDENGDGLPNDTWYELAGSEYGTENETLNYAITYYKPTAAEQDIEWTDNQGGSGIVPYMKWWNEHPSYWQDWVPTERDAQGREYRTYYGSRLKDTHTYENNYSMEPPFAWGYADNLGSDYLKDAKFNANMAMGYYKICNAVKANGQPANLDYINFVKVQTAQTGWTPNLGEISTEVYGIWDYHVK
jgi:DNA-binding beta-propeller fold protein YncE